MRLLSRNRTIFNDDYPQLVEGVKLLRGDRLSNFFNRTESVSKPHSSTVPSTAQHFVNLPEKRPGRWGQGITPAIMKRCPWVELVLVAQVKFNEWTLDDQIVQSVFLGLRTGKETRDVVRE